MSVIGLIGPFGSGCTYIAKYLETKHEYVYLSLTEFLRKDYQTESGNDSSPDRRQLQDFGDEIRQKKGNDFFAKQAVTKIQADTSRSYVIDSIKNSSELDYLRQHLPEFFSCGVFAEPDLRFERVRDNYDGNRTSFDEDDRRDSGHNGAVYGQQVTKCYKMADIVILNNERVVPGNDAEDILHKSVDAYVKMIQKENHFSPETHETYVAVAYGLSMRSSCMQRKVGAVIVDELGTIISSGYNEVPSTQKRCKSEYGMCYRSKLKEDFNNSLTEVLQEKADEVYSLFKKSFKILDNCRALHAEESAILNLARTGTARGVAKIYTTTYPCNLCANKIIQAGIKEVVYFEPYPQKEAKDILGKGKVETIPFSGVTYSGYFRLMEVLD